MVSSRVRTSRRTSSGVPNGSVCCSSIEPQKQSLSPYRFSERRRIHAGRLDRIEHVEADFDHVRDNRVNGAVRVVHDFHARVQAFQLAEIFGPHRLEELRHKAGEMAIPFCAPTSSPTQIASTPISTSFLAAVR